MEAARTRRGSRHHRPARGRCRLDPRLRLRAVHRRHAVLYRLHGHEEVRRAVPQAAKPNTARASRRRSCWSRWPPRARRSTAASRRRSRRRRRRRIVVVPAKRAGPIRRPMAMGKLADGFAGDGAMTKHRSQCQDRPVWVPAFAGTIIGRSTPFRLPARSALTRRCCCLANLTATVGLAGSRGRRRRRCQRGLRSAAEISDYTADAGHETSMMKHGDNAAVAPASIRVRGSRDETRLLPASTIRRIFALFFQPDQLVRELRAHRLRHFKSEQEAAGHGVADRALEVAELPEIRI